MAQHVPSVEERNTYYLDQLFLIAVCGAIAGVTLMLWWSGPLEKLLHPKFHLAILLSSLALLLLVFFRAAAVWISVDAPLAPPDHSHGHGHEADHSHGHGHGHGHGCDHDHGGTAHGAAATALATAPAQGPAPPVVPAPVAHGHGHAHSHGDGHEHGWSPWRYVFLLILVVFYFLVLTNPYLLQPQLLGGAQPAAGAAAKAQAHLADFARIFGSIVWEALPFIILGALIAGLVEELGPKRTLQLFVGCVAGIAAGYYCHAWLGGLSPLSRAAASLLAGVAVVAVLALVLASQPVSGLLDLAGAFILRHRFLSLAVFPLFGLLVPMCECGIVVVMRRLLRKGLPLSCCVAYLLAGPIINVVVLLSTYYAFSGMENVFVDNRPIYQMSGMWMTIFRAGLGYIVAFVTALIVEWQYRKHGDSLLTPLTRPSKLPVVEEDELRHKPLWDRVSNVSETALHDFVDITAFLILGALLAATVRQFLTQEVLEHISTRQAILVILLMMGLAILLCLCSEADAFVAASFVTMRPGAKVAFLVLGPMFDFKLLLMYTRVFRPRLIWTIYTAVLVQVFVYSIGTHYFWEAYKERLVTPVRPPGPPPSPEAVASAARTWALLAQPAPGGAFSAVPVVAPLIQEQRLEKPALVTFFDLEMAPLRPETKSYYEGKLVALFGRAQVQDSQSLTLVRFRYTCCGADATPLKAVIRLEPAPDALKTDRRLPDDLNGHWVRVEGRVRFEPRPGGHGGVVTTILVRPSASKPLRELIEKLEDPRNPYEQ
jgi:uncharacterized membrane protein YraQ (UPF0718 family)